MSNFTSQHIVSTSANLLGFCLFVITSRHLANVGETGLMDEITSGVAILLTFSCFFSFVSIKTKNRKWELWMESLANYLFLVSLCGILCIILLITSNYVHIK